MPRRIATVGGFGGFGGFGGDTPNEYFNYPGGRALVSDVNQARDAMALGGDGGLPRAPIPRSTPSPAPSGNANPGAGAGLVNPRLFRHDNAANKRGWEQGQPNPNRPHAAMDFGDTDTSAATVNRPHSAMDYYDPVTNRPHSAMDFADTSPAYDSDEYWEQYQMGNQQVQVEIPRHAPSERYDLGAIDDNAPSLFESAGTNPFDQWWRTEPVTGSADVSASANTGGSVWAGDDTLGNFSNDLALGNDLGADLGSLGYGEDYPATESPFVESPFAPIAESDPFIPVEPDTLPQDIGDTEWTSTPDDRRFLPEPDATPPPTPTRSLVGGPNLRTFGGPISLGAFLNAPLESLRYGEGYGRITYGGVSEHTSGPIEGGREPGTNWGKMTPAEIRRYQETHDNAGNTRAPDSPFNDGTGTTIIPIEQDPLLGNDGTGTTFIPIQSSTPAGMTIVGYDEQNGQPVYRDANGRLFVNPGTGTPVADTYYNYGTGQREALRNPGSFSDSGNQGAEQQAMSPPKFGMHAAGDAGHSIFNPASGFTARMNDEGGFEMVPTTRGLAGVSRAWADLLTSAQGRARASRMTPAQRSAYAGVSASPGAGG